MEELQKTINTLLHNLANVTHQLNFMKRILLVSEENENIVDETNTELKRIRRFVETTFLGSSLFPFGVEYVYVWQLEDGRYYVGWSENLSRRMDEHILGEGSNWTKKYSPVAIVEIVRGNKDVEKKKTLEYMKAKGWENVRGGPWCLVEYKTVPSEVQKYLSM